MPKQDFLRDLSRSMARIGWPAKYARRIALETSDHWQDLESEAREAGLDDAAAAAFATQRIGKPAVLVQLHQQRMRQAHWSGRHPVWSFAIAPPVLLVVWFGAWTSLALEAFAMYGNLFGLSERIWGSYLIMLFWAKVIHYTGVVAVPAIAWWWAQRSFCGYKWGWVACGACTLHGLLNHVSVNPQSLQWGYGWAAPDWLTLIAPLMVGVMGQWFKWPGLPKVSVAILVIALVTGCASPKQPQERGWIGGEYKKAAIESGGVLVTRLGTNSPAVRSGLREGDLILRVNSQRVIDPQALFKTIDLAAPGSRVSMEILRDGVNAQRSVVVGKELFRPDRSVTIGMLLSREWDLWPNPGFSLVALGYKRQENRIELDSPESRFQLSGLGASQRDTASGLRSREGWEVWLPVCSFSNRKRILAQTAAE